MNNCTKARFELFIVRLFALLGTGVTAWWLAGAAAQYFHYDLNSLLQLGVGAVCGIAAWFASKGLLDFTGDCLDVPSVAVGLHSEPAGSHGQKSHCGKAGCPHPKGKPSVSGAPSSGGNVNSPSKASAATTGGGTNDAPPALGSLLKTTKVSIDTAANPEGGIKVTVVVTGLSASQFKGNNGNNGFRGRVENVVGIKWSKPVNLKDGRRQMEGTITDTTKAAEALGRLTAAVERYK